MKTVFVSVTQDDINRGRRYSPGCCPVARALSRATKSTAKVYPTYAYFDELNVLDMTKRATEFVYRFDEKKPVTPTTFRLRLRVPR